MLFVDFGNARGKVPWDQYNLCDQYDLYDQYVIYVTNMNHATNMI